MTPFDARLPPHVLGLLRADYTAKKKEILKNGKTFFVKLQISNKGSVAGGGILKLEPPQRETTDTSALVLTHLP